MASHITNIKRLALSDTAKDTYVLFIGNVLSAFWGFLFTLIVARSLSIADFGVFSAALNLVVILSSLSDIGISSASVNFVSAHFGRGENEKSDEYIKASFIIRSVIVLGLSLIVTVFAPFVAAKFLATTNSTIALWSAIIPLFLFPDMFFPFILQAKNKFLQSTIMDNAFYIGRLVFAFVFYLSGALTMTRSFLAFGIGFLITVIFTIIYFKTDFLYAKPKVEIYKNLLKFSGWIGVNRIVSSVSGRLDIQMLAAMAGAVATGLYSIPSRLASFIIVLAGSFSSVLATRFASFGNKDAEKKYLVKSSIALLPISACVVFVIVFAKPFILLLFGNKYIDAIPIFQALAAAQIPFLFTVPSVSAIIYAMKKTIYIGVFSFFQIIAIFLLNYVFIPKYGPFGPTITFGVVNTILAIYTWWIVINYYYFKKNSSEAIIQGT